MSPPTPESPPCLESSTTPESPPIPEVPPHQESSSFPEGLPSQESSSIPEVPPSGPIDLNDTDELNDANDPDEPDDPMKLQPQLQGICVYAVLLNTLPGDENDRIDIEGIHMDFRDAVDSLRLLRLGLVDS